MNLLKKFRKMTKLSPIDAYLASGRVPWSEGYKQYRYGLLQENVNKYDLLKKFSLNEELASEYGLGIDERIVEYPWLLSRIKSDDRLVLDAGSALNYPFLLDTSQLTDKKVVIQTLAPESTMSKRANVSYIFGDLRDTLFKNDCFDLIASISTLEHIGMDNSKLYTNDNSHNQSCPADALKVIDEIRRILKPGGRFLMTVPYGRPQNFGWLYQFDSSRLDQIINSFGSKLISRTFYKYTRRGWTLSKQEDCADCEYFDVHSATKPASDLAAAARAVACLEFEKNV